MSLQHGDLVALARRCAERVAEMAAAELDGWYEEHVGYRLLDETPSMAITEQRGFVAAAMFYHALPLGVDTPNAEEVCDLLVEHIEEGAPL